MRTQTAIGILVCVIGVTFVARDAGALWLTLDQAPETVSITEPTHPPPNIDVSPDLQDVVAHMLRESATFRRQCAFIGRLQRLRIRILLEDRPIRERLARARCDMARHEFGGITALVHVWSREDAVELVAHELEHVIEVAEGANYRALALVQPGAVWASDGSFETTRAIDMGLQVTREVRFANAQLRRRR